MKAAILALSALSLAVAAPTFLQADDRIPQPTGGLQDKRADLSVGVAYTSSAARGLLSGYVKGMYKNTNYKPQDKCLNTETQGYFVAFMTIWTPHASDTTWGTAIVSLQKGMLQMSDWCDFDEAVYGYLTFCYNSPTGQCEITYMVSAIMKKIFQLTTVANDFAQIFIGGVPKSSDTAVVIQTFYERIGTNLGKVLRYATDFDPVANPLTQ
jgi:hypothetical protein